MYFISVSSSYLALFCLSSFPLSVVFLGCAMRQEIMMMIIHLIDEMCCPYSNEWLQLCVFVDKADNRIRTDDLWLFLEAEDFCILLQLLNPNQGNSGVYPFCFYPRCSPKQIHSPRRFTITKIKIKQKNEMTGSLPVEKVFHYDFTHTCTQFSQNP